MGRRRRCGRRTRTTKPWHEIHKLLSVAAPASAKLRSPKRQHRASNMSGVKNYLTMSVATATSGSRHVRTFSVSRVFRKHPLLSTTRIHSESSCCRSQGPASRPAKTAVSMGKERKRFVKIFIATKVDVDPLDMS